MELESSKTLPYPQIAQYTSYREFLEDFFAYKKSLRSSFSYRRFAQLVGLKSPNYLQLVIQGKRNLSSATADTIVRALKLSMGEIRYFVALVDLENAEDTEKRRLAEKNLFTAAKSLRTQFVKKDHTELYHHWYHLAVRELVLLKDFEPSGEYISRKLSGIITPEQGEESLRYLLSADHLKFEDGKYIVTDPVLDSGNDIFTHTLMQQFHAQTLKTWALNLERLGHHEQELGLLNIPLPSYKLPELVRKVLVFQDEIIGWAQSLEDCDQLVQLGTYVIPFTKE